MESRKVLEYLENLAFRLGVEIVYEKPEGELERSWIRPKHLGVNENTNRN